MYELFRGGEENKEQIRGEEEKHRAAWRRGGEA